MTVDEVTVSTSGRLHFGFRNLSPKRERLFGSLGVAVTAPRTIVTATPTTGIDCEHERAGRFAERAASLLSVDGAAVTVDSELPPHVGLGSGTQLGLATYRAVAEANDVRPRIREHAPALGRGRRSGIGIAAFERGGFVVDDGHPTAQVLEGRRAVGSWQSPPVSHRVALPASWRFVLVLPEAPPGKRSEEEAQSIRAAIDAADVETAEEIESILRERVLPALAAERIEAFGTAITRIDELNGSWFEAEQDAAHRSRAGAIVDALDERDEIFGVGQSSWGALVYGLTDAEHVEAAHAAGRRALATAESDGRVWVVSAKNHGATVIDSDTRKRTMRTRNHGVTKE